MKTFILRKEGRSFTRTFSQTARNDTKFHTEYKFAPRLSGWDAIDPNAAPSQISTIDALFKNVIANLRTIDISLKDLHTAIAQVPSSCKVKGELGSLEGKFKHDIQGAKDSAVSVWKLCEAALREARKAKRAASRKDAQAPQLSRKDALTGSNIIAKVYAGVYGDDTITALADVAYEAKMILWGAGDAKKLINRGLSTRLKNKGIAGIKGVQAHINAITKLCDSAVKIGNEILSTAEAELEKLKREKDQEKEKAASRKDAAFKMLRRKGVKTFVLRKDGVVATRKDSSAEIASLLKAHGISFSSSSRYPDGLEFSSASLRDKALELIHTSLPYISAFPKDATYDKKTYFLILW